MVLLKAYANQIRLKVGEIVGENKDIVSGLKTRIASLESECADLHHQLISYQQMIKWATLLEPKEIDSIVSVKMAEFMLEQFKESGSVNPTDVVALANYYALGDDQEREEISEVLSEDLKDILSMGMLTRDNLSRASYHYFNIITDGGKNSQSSYLDELQIEL